MRYEKPTDGKPYESNLTAKLLHNAVESLVNKYGAEKEAQGIEDSLGPEKLWMIPEVRQELVEFTKDYFLSNLNPPLPGFQDIFTGNFSQQEMQLEDYMRRLDDVGGSRETSQKLVAETFKTMETRATKLDDELNNIKYIRDLSLNLIRSRDAFAHLHTEVYGLVELAIYSSRT